MTGISESWKANQTAFILAIVGGAVGTFVLGGMIWFIRRRRKNNGRSISCFKGRKNHAPLIALPYERYNNQELARVASFRSDETLVASKDVPSPQSENFMKMKKSRFKEHL